MSDIGPGDAVVYVAHDLCPIHRDDPLPARHLLGRVFRVAAVRHTGCLNLNLVGYGGFVCWGTFRKLNDEPDNAELIERIKQCKPMKQGVPA